jgi:hypothetical protein
MDSWDLASLKWAFKKLKENNEHMCNCNKCVAMRQAMNEIELVAYKMEKEVKNE